MPDPLPERTRVLHVGPGKTGTTAVQSAFHHNRAAIAAHGVHYAGRGSQPRVAANQALTLSPNRADWPLDRWTGLLAEIDAADTKRVVISSEAFCRADDHAAAAIVEALGPDRTHVVLTMRPLADLLSSNWWQSVVSGGRQRLSYNDWLELILKSEQSELGEASFWFRARFDAIAECWANVVGAENVTAVSLATRPRDYVLRVFEQLVDLPEGILAPPTALASNASLTHPVAEMIRQFYEIRRQEGLDPSVDVNKIRGAALGQLRRHPHLLTGEEPIRTPQWAVDAACGVAREMNDRLRTLDIQVIGDLDALAQPTNPAPEIVETPQTIPIADAAALLHEMIRSARRHEQAAVRRAGEKAAVRQTVWGRLSGHWRPRKTALEPSDRVLRPGFAQGAGGLGRSAPSLRWKVVNMMRQSHWAP